MKRQVPFAIVGIVALTAGAPVAQPRVKSASAAAPVMTTDRFAFHSDPWINLHHFLYQWTRKDLGFGGGRNPVSIPERESLSAVAEADREQWSRALTFYRDAVARRGHFDNDMMAVKEQLVRLGADLTARPVDRISGIADALQAAMTVYQRHWWPEHDAGNRKWTASVAPVVHRHEARFVELTARLYGAKWPASRWRVDVSAYANFAGGYTTDDGHVVVFATDSNTQDIYGVESVFHEIQHAEVVGGGMFGALDQAFAPTGQKPPANLWHSLIFATAGAFTQSIATAEKLPPHTAYWITQGFGSLGGWDTLVPIVNQHWVPAVRGEASAVDAFAAMAGAIRPR